VPGLRSFRLREEHANRDRRNPGGSPEDRSYLQEVEEILGRTVLVKGDPLLHQEEFDLA
jgi:hypothetical protein